MADAQDFELLSPLADQAFPVTYGQGAAGLQGAHTLLDWKLLSQLRATVNESGLHSEPTKQLLNYIWGSSISCPKDIKTIVRMIMTQSGQLPWQAHRQRICDISAHMP